MDLLQTVRKEGSRGGRSEFSWSDVQGDAHRENYLGHSLMAPVGRWQKGRDLNWYAKGDADGADAEKSEAERKKEELRKIKEREEDEMRKALGLPPIERDNANLMPLGLGKDEKEVQRIIKEATKPDDDEGADGEKGLGYGSYGSGGRAGDDKEVLKGRDDRPSGGLSRRRRSRSRSRSREHRHRKRHDEDRPRRRRSRSRDRSRDRDREHRRHRSRSREHRHHSRREDREREYRPRRDERDDRRREKSRDGERRRHRSRSPDDRRDRDRDRRRHHD